MLLFLPAQKRQKKKKKKKFLIPRRSGPGRGPARATASSANLFCRRAARQPDAQQAFEKCSRCLAGSGARGGQWQGAEDGKNRNGGPPWKLQEVAVTQARSGSFSRAPGADSSCPGPAHVLWLVLPDRGSGRPRLPCTVSCSGVCSLFQTRFPPQQRGGGWGGPSATRDSECPSRGCADPKTPTPATRHRAVKQSHREA